MKRIVCVLFGVFIGLFFCVPNTLFAAEDYSQENVNGYFQIQSDGSTYFISMDNTVGTQISNFNARFETEFNNFSFPVASGTSISNITLSLRKNDFTNISPNRLIYNCRTAENSPTVFSSNSISQQDWEDIYSKGQFVDFTFLFDPSNCDLSKIISLSLFFERSDPDVAGTNEGALQGVGVGTFVAGSRVFLDGFEWKIMVNSDITNNKIPTLIIPGTLATEIYNGEEKLWLDIPRLIITNNDRFLDELAFDENGLPINPNLSLGSVLGKPVGQFDYSESLKTDFQSEGYLSDKLQFLSYDWRKSISENASGPLKEKIDQIIMDDSSQKINIVAHSQGGLLIKKLIYEHPEYKSKINKLIFVGTPNLGAPRSLKILLDGDSFGIAKYNLGLDPNEIETIAQNMPSVYQMLPTKEYFNHYSGYWGKIDRHIFSTNERFLYDYNTTKQELKDEGFNATLIDSGEALHSTEYDNLDFSDIDTYNIIGCQNPTYAGYLNKSFGKDELLWEPGDGTVPIKSASNILGAKNIFAEDVDHATMLGNEGVRHKIVNLITGSSLPLTEVTEDLFDCQFDGMIIGLHSPVDLHIYDSQGKHVGINPDGAFDSEIPRVGYETIGHEKFAFLPKGNNYKLKLVATDIGSFTFDASHIISGKKINKTYYDSINITASSSAEIVLNEQNNQIIKLDFNGDGVFDSSISPSSVLNEAQSADLLSPISTSTLIGLIGESGFYRSDVRVSLSASDVLGSDSSGLLNIRYSLNGGPYLIYSSSTPVVVTAEGQQTVKFYATDRAGNNELEKEVSFIIDKTAPELIIQFSPALKDLIFTATDTLPTLVTQVSTTTLKNLKLKLVDQDSIITATDQAGNVTVLTLKDRYRKSILKAEVKSLTYNNIPVDVSKTSFGFIWAFDTKGNLLTLAQSVKSKNSFNLLAAYLLGKTYLTGQDQTGKITQTVNGLKLLKVVSDKGDFGWAW